MKRPIVIAFIILLSGLRAFGGENDFSGPVLSVFQGDKLSVKHGNETAYIHLDGVRCLAVGEPLGQEARHYSENATLTWNVTVTYQGSGSPSASTEHWTPAKVTCLDGHILNIELVKEGLAWCTEPTGPAASCRDDLKSAEQQAQRLKLGIWRHLAFPADHTGTEVDQFKRMVELVVAFIAKQKWTLLFKLKTADCVRLLIIVVIGWLARGRFPFLAVFLGSTAGLLIPGLSWPLRVQAGIAGILVLSQAKRLFSLPLRAILLFFGPSALVFGVPVLLVSRYPCGSSWLLAGLAAGYIVIQAPTIVLSALLAWGVVEKPEEPASKPILRPFAPDTYVRSGVPDAPRGHEAAMSQAPRRSPFG